MKKAVSSHAILLYNACMSLMPFERGDSKSGMLQAVPWHTQMFSREYHRANNPELAIEAGCRAERNNLAAARIGLPTVGQVLENQHGIRFQVKEHLYLPNVNTAQRWRIGEKGLPEDLYPVIEPLNLSARLMDFIIKVDRCTTKVFIPVDTMPGFRKDAVPRHNALHTSDPEALLIFLDAVTLHETVLAHEVGHAWVQYVDQCEDERTLADVSDPARLNQVNFIQSYVLDLKVNELLRRKGFDMEPIDGDHAIAMNNTALLLDSGFSPPTKREAVFGALQFAEQIVERERGNRPGLVRFDDALTKLKRYEPEIHRLATAMAEAVFEFGFESKEGITNAIDKCLTLSFEFTGDPLDFENDLVIPQGEEPDFDKWPDWISGAFPRVKCQIGRVMAFNDIPDESTWSLSCHRITGADVSFQLPEGTILGPWRISTPYSVWHLHQMKELDKMNKEASERHTKLMEEVMQRNKENREKQEAAYAMAMGRSIPTHPNAPGQQQHPKPPGVSTMPEPGVPFPGGVPGRRPYMAGLGRFLTEARLAERLGGEHPYAYAMNNPTTYTDPMGAQASYPGPAHGIPMPEVWYPGPAHGIPWSPQMQCQQMMYDAKRVACQVFGTKKGRECVIACIRQCWGDTDLRRFNCLRQWCAAGNNITILPANDPACCVPNPPCGSTAAGTGSGCSIGICQSSCQGSSPCNSVGERRDTVLHEALHCCETPGEVSQNTEQRTDCTSRCIRRCVP